MKNIENLINEDAKKINSYLKKNLPDKILYSQTLWDSMEYSLLAAGKRIRAILFINIIKAAGLKKNDFLSFASAIEALHCYTLIHDDLPALDNDSMRREKPTNHKIFGEATAILAGDTLLTLCFDWASKKLPIAPDKQLTMINRLAKLNGYQGLISGQQADLTANNIKNTAMAKKMLTFIHDYKTTALIISAVETATIAANMPAQKKEMLLSMAKYFGRCFQIIDDIEDYKQDQKTDQKKLTYPAIYGKVKSHQAIERNLKNIEDIIKKLPAEYRFFLDLAIYLSNKTQMIAN